MSRRDDRVRLADILEHARLALDLGGSRTLQGYESDRHMRAGIERYVEIIGDAANHLSDETRAAFPGVPWEKIVATRHIIVHGYDVVRPDILWEIVHDHLSSLAEAIENSLAEGA